MKIKGEEITSLRTINSMYNGDSVEACVKGKLYRLPVETIFKMIKDYSFTIEKKRRWEYLLLEDKNEVLHFL